MPLRVRISNYKTLPDARLIEQLRISDDFAFVEIFNRYSTILFSFTFRRLNDKEVSKDLVHDAFADIWAKRQTINIEGELVAFLFVVIKNRILDYHKHKKILHKYVDQFQKYLDQTQDNTDHLVRHNDLNALIEKEIAALPIKMRVVFELSRNEEMSRKQIASYLNVPENTVKTNLHRALKILKGKLGVVVYLAYCSQLSTEIKRELIEIAHLDTRSETSKMPGGSKTHENHLLSSNK